MVKCSGLLFAIKTIGLPPGGHPFFLFDVSARGGGGGVGSI